MKISVIGLGYIGLPTACLLAKAGHEVFGVDLDQRKIGALKQGKTPFEEKGLSALYTEVFKSGKIQVDKVLTTSDVYLIAVPTPDVDHKADLKYVFSALESVMKILKDGDLIVVESTISPKASVDEIVPLLEASGKKFLLAHCPERAIPGDTLREMVENPRIVGGLTKEAGDKTAQLYKTFVKGEVFVTDITTAESCKVMENTFRDVNIALSNEFCRIAKDLGINVWEAIELANRHPRVNILSPGPGVGGHCIPVDPWFFVGVSKEAKLIHLARERNDSMPQFVVDELLRLSSERGINRPVVGILGVSYKKNVDDARETPASAIISELKKQGIKFHVNDPYVTIYNHELEPLRDVLAKSDVLLVITDHDVYKELADDELSKLKMILDTRNLFHSRKLKNIVVLGDYKNKL